MSEHPMYAMYRDELEAAWARAKALNDAYHAAMGLPTPEEYAERLARSRERSARRVAAMRATMAKLKALVS